jgi:hypothetical protein
MEKTFTDREKVLKGSNKRQKTKSKHVIKPKSYREKKEKEFSYFSLIYTFIHNGQDIERLVSGSKS